MGSQIFHGCDTVVETNKKVLLAKLFYKMI
jgi:hypothetical protein